jgi:hypothetical protein
MMANKKLIWKKAMLDIVRHVAEPIYQDTLRQVGDEALESLLSSAKTTLSILTCTELSTKGAFLETTAFAAEADRNVGLPCVFRQGRSE